MDLIFIHVDVSKSVTKMTKREVDIKLTRLVASVLDVLSLESTPESFQGAQKITFLRHKNIFQRSEKNLKSRKKIILSGKTR